MKSGRIKRSDHDGVRAIEMLKNGDIVMMTYDHEGVVIKPEKLNHVGVKYVAIVSRYGYETMRLLYGDMDMMRFVYNHFAINNDSMSYALKIIEKFPEIKRHL